VLDLGCGDGALLENQIDEHGCSGLGVERDQDSFHACISRGVPVTQGDLEAELHEWFNTPNIHLCTLRDFERLAADTQMRIERRVVLNGNGEAESGPAKLMPNLLGQGAVYSLDG